MLNLIVTVCIIGASMSAPCWDYSSNGPEKWGERYPICLGPSQSPIDITPDDAVVNDSLHPVDRNIFYDIPTEMTVSNNGHSLIVTYTEGAYEIDVDWLLPFKARISQYHMHWGNTSFSGGSEHTVDGKRFFGELHAVHYNTKYANFTEAVDKADGLAVFGWFIDIDRNRTNQNFEVLLQIAVDSVKEKGDAVLVDCPFSLETLLPGSLQRYYQYQGSLTVPGCYQSVFWTVFDDPIIVSMEQAGTLAGALLDAKYLSLQNNFRPVQPLNGRTVMKSPKSAPDTS